MCGGGEQGKGHPLSTLHSHLITAESNQGEAESRDVRRDQAQAPSTLIAQGGTTRANVYQEVEPKRLIRNRLRPSGGFGAVTYKPQHSCIPVKTG
ncbi:hypothetical protein SKAU_G00348000 [Synaphobranchus kaupii]|uniref:Uncharacterized protein n=1 Tax=Synaphobranchus kaupii TaxID=118154 RepID=A0A9Q1EJW7_SYNKA|nr:hypothetical protein SKAU_G00348000 [Synaphobranchus kaupii]